MFDYVDHFEIQTQRPGEDWIHAGNVYPEYKWETYRPWYFLWLVKRPIITNEGAAWTTRFESIVGSIIAMPKSDEKVRLVTWLRRGNELIRTGAIEPC